MNIVDQPGSDHPLTTTEDFSRVVNALFDSRDRAETAHQDLLAAGIAADAISLVADGGSVEADGPVTGGFWESMKELFMPDEAREQFEEGVRRGGVAVVVRTDTANHDRVVALLDRDGAVDLDERQESWRHDGWTGSSGRDPLTEARSPSLAFVADDEDMSYAPASAATAGFGVAGLDHFPMAEAMAPPVESPGALPSSALEAGAVADLSNLSRPRVRSYALSSDRGLAAGTSPELMSLRQPGASD